MNCYADNPPRCDEAVTFSNLGPSQIVLHVPVGSKELYQNRYWNKFKEIIDDLGTTGVDDVSDRSGVTVHVDGSRVTVVGAEEATVEVYTLAGAKAFSGMGDEGINLPHGVYLVKVGSHVEKVMVK